MRKKNANTTTVNTTPAPVAPAPQAAPTKPARKKRDPNAVRVYLPRDPEKRIKDPERARRLFRAFIDGASPARIDYPRLGADEGAVAGLLAQLTILAFGQDGEGGFRKASAGKLKRSKAVEGLRPGMIVRYKKASEQAEVEEDAGKGVITILKVGAKTVRVVCNGYEFTPNASQIEIDPTAQQPSDDDAEIAPSDPADDRNEIADEDDEDDGFDDEEG